MKKTPSATEVNQIPKYYCKTKTIYLKRSSFSYMDNMMIVSM